MRILSLAAALYLSQNVYAEEAAESTQAADIDWEPISLSQEMFNEQVIKVTEEGATAINELGWFVKFYAPWCGHCKNLAPTWAEFRRLHMEDLNVAHVDCTSSEGSSLCSTMEVRGYPSLLFFPPKGAEGDDTSKKVKAIKYTGPRNIEGFEDFAFNGGYQKSGDDNYIPVGLGKMESWGRWLSQQHMMVTRDIDYAWKRYGLYDYVPAPYHYSLVIMLCCLPFLLICGLLCCMIDEEEPQFESYKAKPQPAGSKGSKVTNKPEKLD